MISLELVKSHMDAVSFGTKELNELMTLSNKQLMKSVNYYLQYSHIRLSYNKGLVIHFHQGVGEIRE